ncbi:glycosyltransferase [Flavobacterium sp. GP15]|uniref:glycosyltransferase n=1 Tax=Flavobacterium sp. GP15 TaxID=2758567 RepID=UPI00165DD368|nr:glycosyltransferase [Flavobacterium sp. GP15]
MVYVYALCDVYYDSFYLKGLQEVFSKYSFNIDKFPKFRQGIFAVIIEEGNLNIKIIIDSTDSNTINMEELKWCDIYGKVNYNTSSLPTESLHKIKPIGPSFAIKIWNLPFAVYISFFNFIKFKRYISNKREFFANYWRQSKRLPMRSYYYTPAVENYIFFAGSIWRNEKETNNARAAFIKSSKRTNVFFEGGFAPRNNGDNMGFENLVVTKRYSIKEYIKKIKKSAVVFNTPAVLSCHGWKLAEFLALGKSIISTHHINELPSELKENEHILYVDDLDSMDDKIKTLLKNKQVRERLEKNTRKYFEEFLSPKSVITRLINFNSIL